MAGGTVGAENAPPPPAQSAGQLGQVSRLRDRPLNAAGTCPVCAAPMPAPKARGRRREFCSQVCVERARQRRRRAAGLLEYALRLDEIAADPPPGFGNGTSSARHATRLREMAEAELRGLPL